jgi:hypothetical protein
VAALRVDEAEGRAVEPATGFGWPAHTKIGPYKCRNINVKAESCNEIDKGRLNLIA